MTRLLRLRSWFLKVLKVDIPVLKLVGGSTLDEVCELAMKKLPQEDLVGHMEISGSSEGSPGFSGHSPLQPPLHLQPSTQAQSASAEVSTTPSDDETAVPPGLQTPPPVYTPGSAVTQAPLPLSPHDKDLIQDSKEPKHTSEVLSGTFTGTVPISVGQSRFWFLQLLAEDPTTFNVTSRFHLTGTMRAGDLERALRVVTARHEALRTCFIGNEHDEADQASQVILARSPIRLERETVGSTEEVAAEYERLRAHVFDLARGPLLRLMLMTLSPTSHYLLVSYHHIIMDMASFQVLTSELENVYNGQSLETPPRQYPDFSVAQRQALDNGELDDELGYWRGVFPAGEQPPILPLLPMARSSSRVATASYDVHQVGARLEPALAARVKAVAKAQRSTPFHFYLATLKTMLFSFTDARDLTIGIADANRHDSDTMGSIGFFLNLLTLRFRRRPRLRFADAIVEARETAYSALANSRLPFDVLLGELNIARSALYSPFFQAFFDYRQQTADKQTWCGCRFDLEEMHPGRTAYDISLDVADLGSADVHITLRVQTSIYDKTAANLLLETYRHLVRVLAHDFSLPLEDTPLFSEEQLARGARAGLGPDLISDWPVTLPHRIDQVAQDNPGKVALVDGLGGSLVYAAMIKRIEAIAEVLVEAGVGPNPTSRVLVFQQASVDWICSMLAIMRIGGVYVPLDLRNPMSRLAAQAGHCQPSAVLVDGTTVHDAPGLNVTVVIDVSRVGSAPSAPVANSANPDAPAAILYTSGSTGTPKRIFIRHWGLRNET